MAKEELKDKEVDIIDKADVHNIFLLLGKIERSLAGLEKQSTRITLALIGVVAAQIGIKVLGTPPLLDIATAISIIGAVLMFGAVFMGLKFTRIARQKFSLTGIALIVMMGLIFAVQTMVYFRDLGVFSPNVIYAVRIPQNLAILFFAWRFMVNRNLCVEETEAKHNDK